MSFGSVDPARLRGAALDAWYRRTPDEIERERRAAEQSRYRAFFGRSADVEASSGPSAVSLTRAGDGALSFNALRTSPEHVPTKGAAPTELLLAGVRSEHPAMSKAARPAGKAATPGAGGAVRQLPPGTPPLPTFTSTLFGGPAPLHGPGGSVIGYYDHEAAKAGLELTSKYAAIAPLFQPGGWMEAFPAEGGTVITNAIREGIEEPLHSHHVLAKFLGGPNEQERELLRKTLHITFHKNLASALKAAGFLNVGGRGGAKADWAEYFAKNPGRFDRAMEILRQVSQDFDRAHGTDITSKLEREIAKLRDAGGG